jgi:hypothetical protein
MPKPRRNPTLFPDLGACTKCRAEVMLVRIEPARDGFDLRSFECSQCNNVDQYIVEHETSAGWTLVVRS